MFDLSHVLTLMTSGLFNPGPFELVLITLVLTHITIVSVTVYLHRHSAHRALDLHPLVSHFFRFWLWLTTAMNTLEWTAIHRKHHARCETPEDPHSPQTRGLGKVLLEGAELYRAEAENEATLKQYGAGCPNDWIERNLYSRFPIGGVTLMALINLACFGVIGITVWAIQMMWIPIFAAGVINGIGHFWGYRNFECSDASRNISPLGLLIGGEELHNNHHTYPNSAKLSVRKWEFDIGWFWIRVMETLRLAKVNKVAPRPFFVENKHQVDLDTVRAVVLNRFQVMAQYRKNVVMPVLREEKTRATEATRAMFDKAKKLLVRDDSLIDERARQRLTLLTEQNETLKAIYEFRLRLQEIWARTSKDTSERLDALKCWCQDAEQSGIRALQEFAQHIKSYNLQPAQAHA